MSNELRITSFSEAERLKKAGFPQVWDPPYEGEFPYAIKSTLTSGWRLVRDSEFGDKGTWVNQGASPEESLRIPTLGELERTILTEFNVPPKPGEAAMGEIFITKFSTREWLSPSHPRYVFDPSKNGVSVSWLLNGLELYKITGTDEMDAMVNLYCRMSKDREVAREFIYGSEDACPEDVLKAYLGKQMRLE